jgi:hypothetical protein
VKTTFVDLGGATKGTVPFAGVDWIDVEGVSACADSFDEHALKAIIAAQQTANACVDRGTVHSPATEGTLARSAPAKGESEERRDQLPNEFESREVAGFARLVP